MIAAVPTLSKALEQTCEMVANTNRYPWYAPILLLPSMC